MTTENNTESEDSTAVSEADRFESYGDETNDGPKGEVVETTANEDVNTPESSQDDDDEIKLDIAEDDPFADYPNGFKKQLKRKTRANDRLSRELAEERKRRADLESRLASLEKRNPEQKITRSHFKKGEAGDQEYQQYLIDQRIKELSEKENARNLKEQEQAQHRAHIQESWNQKVIDNYPDEASQQEYMKAIEAYGGNADRYFSQDVLGYILQSDVGPKMFAYLAKRPDVIARLRQSHPLEAGGILNTLSAYMRGKAPAEKGKVNVQSNAPRPTGGLGTGMSTKDPDAMSDDELFAFYRKHGRMPG